MNSNYAALTKGAVGGGVATLLMSMVMLAGQKIGRVGKLPPKKIMEATAQLAAGPQPSERAMNALAVAGHFGYGIGAGSVYALTVGRLRWPEPLLGMLFGLGVWTVSYKGWVPALGIMPPAERDRPHRVSTMVLAHLIYGGVLGLLARRAFTNSSTPQQFPRAPRPLAHGGARARR